MSNMPQTDGMQPDVPKRKPILLRLDPRVHEALALWANDEFRSINAHVEMLLRQALQKAGRDAHLGSPQPLRRGRPRKDDAS